MSDSDTLANMAQAVAEAHKALAVHKSAASETERALADALKASERKFANFVEGFKFRANQSAGYVQIHAVMGGSGYPSPEEIAREQALTDTAS